MKFRVTMKDPDTLHDAVRDAVNAQAKEYAGLMDLDDDERAQLVDSRCEKVRSMCCRWFEYGEYLTVEIDTEAKTCVVVENEP